MKDQKGYRQELKTLLQEIDAEELRLKQREIRNREMALEFLKKLPNFHAMTEDRKEHLIDLILRDI